jgi:hypothetical protein
MRKRVGLILAAAGAGAALIWFLRGKVSSRRVHRRDIIVKEKKGDCGIERQPDDVTMERNDQLHWIISNASQGNGGACDRAVEVCVTNWRPSNPFDDVGGGRFCRTVRPGQTKTLPARVKQHAESGQYHYEVWIDGQLAIDPMVEIVT